MKNPMVNAPPLTSSDTTVPELSQSRRFPWSRPANSHAQLGDQLGGCVALEPPAAEDEVGNVGPEAELFGELQLVFFTEAGDVVLPVVDDLGADVRELTVSEPLAQGEDATPDAVAGLQHYHLVAGGLHFRGGDQARQPGADDQHLHAASVFLTAVRTRSSEGR